MYLDVSNLVVRVVDGGTAGGGLEIVQVVRRMHPYGGAGGVAHAA